MYRAEQGDVVITEKQCHRIMVDSWIKETDLFNFGRSILYKEEILFLSIGAKKAKMDFFCTQYQCSHSDSHGRRCCPLEVHPSGEDFAIVIGLARLFLCKQHIFTQIIIYSGLPSLLVYKEMSIIFVFRHVFPLFYSAFPSSSTMLLNMTKASLFYRNRACYGQ